MASINTHLRDTCSPPIPGARRWIESYDGRVGHVINLSQAAPGTPPPASLLSALASAAGDPRSTSYGPIRGEPELIRAYAKHVSKLYQSEISQDEIAITAGCNEAFFITILAVASAGDSILLPTPWYFNHAMTLSMLGIEAIPLPTYPESGFVPDAGMARELLMERARTQKSLPKAIVLVSPNNPTGAVYPSTVIESFAALASEIGGWIVLDETYRDFLPDPNHYRPHGLLSGTNRDHFIQLYSFSKSYSIPGYRLGAMLVPAAIMCEIDKVLDSLQICPGRAGQIAVAPAIEGLETWRSDTAAEIRRRAAAFSNVMSRVPGWRIDAIGAYFAYVSHPFSNVPDAFVAEQLARERGILVLPGSFFGVEHSTHLRFAFANTDESGIAELPSRLAGFDPVLVRK